VLPLGVSPQQRPDEHHGRPGRADQIGQYGPSQQERDVGPRSPEKIAREVDAARDHVQRGQQHEERDEVFRRASRVAQTQIAETRH